MRDLVSVIIPVFNREKYIARAIESVQSQTYSKWELIICDNHSTDGTVEVVKKYMFREPRIRLVVNEKNLGPVKNWIVGMSYAKGEYIKMLWSDDWIDANFFEETISMFQHDKTIAFVFSPAFITDGVNGSKNYIYHNRPIVKKGVTFIRDLIFSNRLPVSPACAIFRSDCIDGNIILEIPNEHNLDFISTGAGPDLLMFLLPLLSRKAKFGFTDRTNAYFFAHTESITMSHDLSEHYESAKRYYLRLLNKKILSAIYLLKNRKYISDRMNKYLGVERSHFILAKMFLFLKRIFTKIVRTFECSGRASLT